MEKITGFAPVAGADCRLLILGTAPSAESLRAGFYYAHPRNAFWRILADTFTRPSRKRWGRRRRCFCKTALPSGTCSAPARAAALWTAPFASRRPTTLPPFSPLIRAWTRVLFNGAAAESLFFRFCGETLAGRAAARLPSTSPAYTLSYAQKLQLWRKELLR